MHNFYYEMSESYEVYKSEIHFSILHLFPTREMKLASVTKSAFLLEAFTYVARWHQCVSKTEMSLLSYI